MVQVFYRGFLAQNVGYQNLATNWAIYNRGNKLSGQMRKTAVCLTPQAMYNQFKRPSAASVSELYYICRKT